MQNVRLVLAASRNESRQLAMAARVLVVPAPVCHPYLPKATPQARKVLWHPIAFEKIVP